MVSGGGGGGVVVPEVPATEFESHDHTDLYTVKRDRDRAWEQAKKGSGGGGGGGGGGGASRSGAGGAAHSSGAGVGAHKATASTRRSSPPKNPVELGQWIQLGDNYAFVSKHSGAP